MRPCAVVKANCENRRRRLCGYCHHKPWVLVRWFYYHVPFAEWPLLFYAGCAHIRHVVNSVSPLWPLWRDKRCHVISGPERAPKKSKTTKVLLFLVFFCCCEIFNDRFIANFLENATVKELSESPSIWRSYCVEHWGLISINVPRTQYVIAHSAFRKRRTWQVDIVLIDAGSVNQAGVTCSNRSCGLHWKFYGKSLQRPADCSVAYSVFDLRPKY